MSYILDALRKADAERERGSVPGLHTQAALPVSAQREPPRRGVPLPWVAGGAAVVMAGALAWNWSGRDAAPEPARAVETMPPGAAAKAAPVQPVPSPSPLPAPVPAPAPVMAAAPPAPQAAPAPAPPAVRPTRPAPAVVAKAPAPVPAARPRPTAAAPGARAASPDPAAKRAMPDAAAQASTAAAAAASAPAAGAPEAKVYAVNDLPPDIRRDWPQLSIGGSIYSETPASRFLIINGQIYHEGDALPNGLSLEQIKLKAAVLRYKGYRVGITY